MTYSFLSSGPGSSDRSWIRLRIGDNSSSNVLLQDEDIDSLLDDYGNKWAAGAACARSVGASFSRQVSKQVGKFRISMQDASNHYFNLADSLDLEGDQRSGGADVGGVSLSDKKLAQDDSDWTGSAFETNQFKNPASGDLTQRNG